MNIKKNIKSKLPLVSHKMVFIDFSDIEDNNNIKIKTIFEQIIESINKLEDKLNKKQVI